ncbi:hypothetical protein [Streptomyces sp. NPDC126933]|uniref:hypothetical protein n=1 Tax=unclassified Streptomyces TaxID=2593676 RepID=UPI0036604180
MRLRHALAIGVTAAATIAPTVALADGAEAESGRFGPESVPDAPRQSTCGKTSDPNLPIKTRIHGGPAAYLAGGDTGNWNIDLTNTTREPCRTIYPVVVLVDRNHELATSQVTLEIVDGEGHRRPMTLESTDQDEIIGVLDDGSPGFAVPAGRTVTVRARLAFAARTPPNKVQVSAATVQRRGDDGDWVGRSDAYRLTIVDNAVKADRDNEVASGSGNAVAGATRALAGTGTGPGDLLGRLIAAGALLTAGAALITVLRRLRTEHP